jgi:hypothetical protein
MCNCRPLALGIGAKEDGRAEHSLKRCDQSAVLGTALLHSEDIEHFGCTAEGNGLFLLSHGKCRQENGNQAVLTPWNTILGMTGDLQKKLTVPALVYEYAFGRALNRQSAQDKGPRGKPQILRRTFPVQPDELNRLGLAELPF